MDATILWLLAACLAAAVVLVGRTWAALKRWNFSTTAGGGNNSPPPTPNPRLTTPSPSSNSPISCGSCTGRWPVSCMWCSATDTCYEAAEYLQTYPWGTCWDWHYGATDCPAPCAAYDDCGSCHTDPTCGWCASTQTCEAGTETASDESTCSGPDWDFTDCPCADAADCGECAGSPYCGWCADTLECLRLPDEAASNGTASSPADSCDALDDEVCYVCDVHASCDACTADRKCGWCAETGVCLRGGATSPVTCPGLAWDYDVCDRCGVAAYADNCTACTADPHCGWCFWDSVCVRGEADGPYNATVGSSCLWDYAACDPHCDLFGNCSSCGAASECGWCCGPDGSSCLSAEACASSVASAGGFGDNTAGPNVTAWHPAGCPVCTAGADACEACTSDACCAWCGEGGSGGSGACSVLDPAWSDGERLQAAGNCSADAYYDPVDACPLPCSSLSECGSCLAQRHCGWCAETSACLDTATDAGQIAVCQFWRPEICPADCGTASENCGACTSLGSADDGVPDCYFCGDVGSAWGSTCVGRHELAANASLCTVDGAAFVPMDTCEVPCSAVSSSGCTACLADSDCGWCQPTDPLSPGACVNAYVHNATDGAACGLSSDWVDPLPPGQLSSTIADACPSHCRDMGDNCGACTAEEGCFFCLSENECQDLLYDVPSCLLARADCQDFCAARGSNCTACAERDECGFCGHVLVDHCMAGDAAGPALGTCASDWDYSTCTTRCRDHTTCRECLEDDECGFCSSPLRCMNKDELTGLPSEETCLAGWDTEACDSFCSFWSSSCQLCLEDHGADCGYCAADSRCKALDPSTGDPSGGADECPVLWRTDECPTPCATHDSCGACVADPNCGFCSVGQSGLCLEGDALAPARGEEYCPHDKWEVGSCNAFCRQNDHCFECTSFSECGYCGDTGTCHSGNISGPAWDRCDTGWSWLGCEAPDTADPITDDTNDWTGVSFWVIYFMGVFFGTLLAIVLVAVIVKRVRDNMDRQRQVQTRAQRRVALARRPVAPIRRVLVPGPPAASTSGDDDDALAVAVGSSSAPLADAKGGAVVASAMASSSSSSSVEQAVPTGHPYFLLSMQDQSPEPLVCVVVDLPAAEEDGWLGNLAVAVVSSAHGINPGLVPIGQGGGGGGGGDSGGGGGGGNAVEMQTLGRGRRDRSATDGAGGANGDDGFDAPLGVDGVALAHGRLPVSGSTGSGDDESSDPLPPNVDDVLARPRSAPAGVRVRRRGAESP